MGRNTTPIADLPATTGANTPPCAFTGDFAAWEQTCRQYGRSSRRNISPRLIETGTPDAIYEVACRKLRRGRNVPGFIMGTAVVPFGTPTENVVAIKRACIDSASW